MLIDRLIFAKHLEDGEKILYTIHKHWIEIVKASLEVAFFGFILPWSLYVVGFNAEAFFWVAVAWSVLAYIRFMYLLVDWYCDAWLITNLSVIVVEWNGIFDNVSSRCGYDDIEGATYYIKGFWGTIMRYGNMTLRLMSASNFDIKNAANPKKAELALARFQDKYINEQNMQNQDMLKELLTKLVKNTDK